MLHLPPEIGLEIYTSGPPVLIGHLVPYNKFQITVSGAPLADRVPAPSSEPEGVRKKQIKVVVDNDQIGISWEGTVLTYQTSREHTSPLLWSQREEYFTPTVMEDELF